MRLIATTLHELLEIALEDLKKSEESGDIIDMDVLYLTDPQGKCHVCLAGAVMKNTLKVLPGGLICGEKGFDEVLAINCLRMGEIRHAYWLFYNKPLPLRVEGYIPITEYATHPGIYKENMQQLIDHLKYHEV